MDASDSQWKQRMDALLSRLQASGDAGRAETYPPSAPLKAELQSTRQEPLESRGLGEDVEEQEDREVDVESELSAWEASIAKRSESLDALESMLEKLPCAVKGGVRMTTTSGPAIMTQESMPQQNSRRCRLPAFLVYG
ncbi:hypothetical protein AK812_SmicGene24230 [Symbiodinium microadriaticum]|uniref:Uncharacterized protein n=1 Tax=Symbiodinium microadriaticum TaxID=2951 RepID=A0A1Q9DF53_SYMMI|nr:hypothetical protein AK812_SmicGene24230 [Symbiodinium microadriaticum]